MSKPIQLLPPEVSIKIAAGEVIERPASIVKELLENALDAAATVIRIGLEGGGKEEIVVQDNGSGIAAHDVPLAFERFATSKISGVDDLFHLSSLGFRGEALPSIASIARIEMTTRTAQEETGTHVTLRGGKVVEQHETGCPVGTRVRVTQLFEEVPARLKFLKSAATEQAYCLEQVTRIMLGREGVRVEVVSQGKSLLSLPATKSAEERIAFLLGRETSRHLLPLQPIVEGPYRLWGFLSTPTWSKTTGRDIHCFVNGRPIRDPLINHALLSAYRHILPPRRYPVALLYVEVPSEEVDVNVHPSKREVRFQHPQTIYGLISEGIIHTLSGLKPAEVTAENLRHRVAEAVERYYGETKRPLMPAAPPSPPPSLEPDAPEDTWVFLSQFAGTYLLFLTPEGIVIMDQHAAHERILYDRLQAGEELRAGVAQNFLVPLVMTLTPQEYATVTELLPLFSSLGVELEPFGPLTIAVKAIPATLKAADPTVFIRDVIAEMIDRGVRHTEKRERLIASLACRGLFKRTAD